ncbi:MAG: hypothetical protein OXG76_02170 [Acidimicrobiaceae bacterium]|nr:hypothetical protein [Acidimicrobiaceae bacterium]
MSEQDRSRLYDWWCEHADEALAEYAMSCLSPVPLPDLATKEDFVRLETATKEDFARLDVRVDKLDAKLDRLVDAREADRENSRTQFHWLIGLGATGFGVLLAAMFALAAIS